MQAQYTRISLTSQAIAPADKFDGLNQKPLFFIHIPKTAGGSLQRFLEDRFNDSEVFQGWNTMDLARASESDLHCKRLFRGHFTAGQASNLEIQDIEWITIVREPRSLVTSMYNWLNSLDLQQYYGAADRAAGLRNQKLHFGGQKLLEDSALDAANRLTFQEYLVSSDEAIRLVRDHILTKMLSDFGVSLDGPVQRFLSDSARDKLRQRTEQALKNIKRISVVGLFEELTKSVLLLCWRRNWPYEDLGERRHKSPDKPLLNHGSDDRNVIEKAWSNTTESDEVVYAVGKKIFHDQFAQFEEAFVNSEYHDYQEFLRENHARSFFEKQTPIQTCDVDARQAWPGWGWGPRCRNEHGQVWRLIGPTGKATLLLRVLAEKSYWLFLRVFSAPATYDVSKIVLRAFNNAPVAPVVSMHEGYLQVAYRLDSSLVAGCGANLRLTIDTGRPEEQIALHSLLLMPA